MSVGSTMSCHKTNSSVANNGSNSMSDNSSMGVVLSLHLVVVADRSGHTDLDRHAHLPGNWVADLPRDLARVLDRPLLALPLGVGVALGSSGVAVMDSVSVAGVGLPLAIAVSCVATMVHLGIVADHTRAVVDLLRHLVALLSHDILAVLDISGVHDGVILGVACLVVLGVAGSVSGRVVDCGADLLAVAVVSAMAVAGSSSGKPEGKEGQGKVQHSRISSHLDEERVMKLSCQVSVQLVVEV